MCDLSVLRLSLYDGLGGYWQAKGTRTS